jgi:spore germination protein GerM
MKRSGHRRRTLLILAAFVASAVILGLLMLQKYEQSKRAAEPPAITGEPASVIVTLFFATPDGTALVREAREIESCEGTEECAEAVLEELLNGPVGENTPTLPPTTGFNSVTMEGNTAVVDMDPLYPEGSGGGSHGEMMAVYSIIDTLAFNFPQIKQVSFLIEGKQVSSLGHLDLSTPLPPDFSLERQQPEHRPATQER